MSVISNNIKSLTSTKSNIVIIWVLLAILSAIAAATAIYLDNSITNKKILVANMEMERSKKEADKRIANAPFERW